MVIILPIVSQVDWTEVSKHGEYAVLLLLLLFNLYCV